MALAICRRRTLMARGFPDGPFPPGYGPVSAPIEAAGYLLFALQPMRADVPRVFILRAYGSDGCLVGEKRPALEHDNRFGPDVEDLARLEAATEELLDELATAAGE